MPVTRMMPLSALLLTGAATAAAPLSPRMAEAFRKQYPNIRIVESDDEDKTSVNYLTREARFRRKLDGKRKEKRPSFKMPALMTLKTFSYDTHYNAMPEELHGHIDDQLRFVEGK